MAELHSSQTSCLRTVQQVKRVWISRKALNELERNAEDKEPLETGGLLVGYFSEDDDDVVITGLTGPGPKAKHGKCFFCPDYDGDRLEIGRIFAESFGKVSYLGDWHTHPTGSSYLSFLDRRALKNIAKFPHNYVDRPIMLILGKSGEERQNQWTPCAWRISPLSRRILGARWRFASLDVKIFDI